jgi:hypothetical protein
MQHVTKAILTLALATLTTSAFAAPRLRSVVGAGTGCPVGSVRATLKGSTITLALPDLTAEGGDGGSLSTIRANCTLSFAFSAPRQQVAIDAIDGSFDSDLADDATAKFSAYAYVQGQGENHDFADLDITAEAPRGTAHLATEDLAWTPCGASRNLNLQLANLIDAQGALSSATVTPKTLHIKVRNCQ